MSLSVSMNPGENVADLKRYESVLIISGKIMLTLLLGTFSLSAYPVPVNVVALLAISLILFHSLQREDYFSFLIQLFFTNQYVFGNDKGGLFNVAALIALLLLSFTSGKKMFAQKSSFGNLSTVFVVILICCQILSLLNNTEAGTPARLTSFVVFVGIIVLVLQLSKIHAEKKDFIRFIYVLLFFSGYSIIIALNQKFGILPFSSPLLPTWDDIEFQYDVFRCGGTFVNFEAYAEYSLSIILLLLPGILSGSFKEEDNKLYYACLVIVLISTLAIILTVTRSSFFLIPVGFVYILVTMWSRIRVRSTIPLVVFVAVAIFVNSLYGFVDISSFIERSQEMKVSKLSDVFSGSEINRGEIFDYAFKKIGRMNGLLGEGYFTSPDEYKMVHFDTRTPDVSDYHNLYLGIAVFWGFIGAFCFIMFFIMPLIKGNQLYRKIRRDSGIEPDLLTGFNTLFVFLLINQYKIIFLRESNYAMVMFLFLVMYKSLIRMIEQKYSPENQTA